MCVSVLILTLNEERNLAACLKSVAWSDDIVVFDSYSKDRTVEIAESAGARVVQREFDDWASHQNWALKNIEFKNPWVYYSDADEIVTNELRDELIEVSERKNDQHVAYRVRYRNYFMGRWIRHASMYPVWVMRFFRPECVHWERIVNPTPVIDGITGKLQGHFQHFSFNKGLEEWIEKHNRYSTQEAIESLRSLNAGIDDRKGIFAVGDPARQRQALKELSFRLPCRPLLRFLYMYVWRRGFLDGRPGLTYCRLLAMYEYMIVLKMKEIERRKRRLPV
ncbi:MAG: glycosyltransferase family 2 protein [Gammaproteobacteria bacterium]